MFLYYTRGFDLQHHACILGNLPFAPQLKELCFFSTHIIVKYFPEKWPLRIISNLFSECLPHLYQWITLQICWTKNVKLNTNGASDLSNCKDWRHKIQTTFIWQCKYGCMDSINLGKKWHWYSKQGQRVGHLIGPLTSYKKWTILKYYLDSYKKPTI